MKKTWSIVESYFVLCPLKGANTEPIFQRLLKTTLQPNMLGQAFSRGGEYLEASKIAKAYLEREIRKLETLEIHFHISHSRDVCVCLLMSINISLRLHYK